MGILFEGMLNRRYGSCNFTSFVRFMVPHDEEQKCLAFIKYVPSNYLTESTKKLVMQLLVQEQINEQAIAALWGKVDR